MLKKAKTEHKIEKTSSVETINHKMLCSSLRSILESEDDEVPTLQQLLKSADIYLTHHDAVAECLPRPRNAELERRLGLLNARLENEKYEKLVRNMLPSGTGSGMRIDAGGSVENDIKIGKLAPQMSLGLNVLVTMATCFTAAYYVFKHSTGSEVVGLIAGVIGLIVAMIVEAVLLLTKLYTLDDTTRKQEQLKRRRLRPIAQQGPTSIE